MPTKKEPNIQGNTNDNIQRGSNRTNATTALKEAPTTRNGNAGNKESVQKNAQGTQLASANKPKKPSATRIKIKYDVGFGNQIFIRGEGANLSWDKGQLLHNSKNDEWIWEIDLPFNTCEFKVLINDEIFEQGNNRTLKHGADESYTPRFF